MSRAKEFSEIELLILIETMYKIAAEHVFIKYP